MANIDLQFRIASPDDAAQLQTLVQSAFRGKIGWTTERYMVSGERITVEGIIAKITAPNSAILMATANDVLVACFEAVKRSADLAYIGLFAVDPHRQGGGLGRQVLTYAENYCRRIWGVEKAEISVTSCREELIAWYIRRGYHKTGESKPFPYEEIKGVSLRHDLVLTILEKDLGTEAEAVSVG